MAEKPVPIREQAAMPCSGDVSRQTERRRRRDPYYGGGRGEVDQPEGRFIMVNKHAVGIRGKADTSGVWWPFAIAPKRYSRTNVHRTARRVVSDQRSCVDSPNPFAPFRLR
jgi:hypothetical protein